jgi:hypothetical protein
VGEAFACDRAQHPITAGRVARDGAAGFGVDEDNQAVAAAFEVAGQAELESAVVEHASERGVELGLVIPETGRSVLDRQWRGVVLARVDDAIDSGCATERRERAECDGRDSAAEQ